MFTICFLCSGTIRKYEKNLKRNVASFSVSRPIEMYATHNTSHAKEKFIFGKYGEAENETEKEKRRATEEKIIINYSYHTIQ